MYKNLILVGSLLLLALIPFRADAKDYNQYFEERQAIQAIIVTEANKYGVDPGLAIFIAANESDFNPKAKSKISTATGIFQFVIGTWKAYCAGDRTDATDNIRCAVKLLSEPRGIKHWIADPVMFRKLYAAGFVTESGLLARSE